MIPEGLSFNVTHVDNGGAADYQTDDGVCYPDICDIIHTGILDFCGCGDPKRNLEYILEGLEYIDRKIEFIDIFGNDRSRAFFFYWADKEGLTEHGGTVDSSWLTIEGENLMGDIKILKESGLI